MGTTGKLVVISGPSGVGKSTIVREALRRTGADFSVSATTRAPRPGEVDGRDYWFIDRQQFQRMMGDGQLLEHAEVFGRLYGTPAGPIRQAIEQGRTVLLDIDVQGAVQVHQKMPDAMFVLVLPPDDEELERRLRGRKSEADAEVQQRLGKARQEIQAALDSGVYNHQIVNADLEEAIRQVVELINQENDRR